MIEFTPVQIALMRQVMTPSDLEAATKQLADLAADETKAIEAANYRDRMFNHVRSIATESQKRYWMSDAAKTLQF